MCALVGLVFNFYEIVNLTDAVFRGSYHGRKKHDGLAILFGCFTAHLNESLVQMTSGR